MAKNIFETGAASAPSHEQIARRAHEIWEGEGRPEGRAMEHWLQAVSELKAQRDGELEQPEELRAEKPRPTRRSTPRTPQRRFQPAG